MKKYKIIIAFLLLAINIIMGYFNPLNTTALIIKHTALLLLLTLGTYELINVLSKKLIRKYSPTGVKESIVYIGSVLSFTLIIILFSTFQLKYVQFNETSLTEGCKYYDQYNNLIYKSRFYGSCPELEILENNENTLLFNVNEYFLIEDMTSIIDEIAYDNSNIELRVFTSIQIEYVSEQITSVEFLSTYHNDTISDEFSGTSYHSIHKQISYSYINDFESTLKEARYSNNYDYLMPNSIEHHQFNDEDFSTVHYYLEDGYYSTNDILYHLVKDYTDEEDIFQTEEIASINFKVEEDVKSYTIIPLLSEIDKYVNGFSESLLNRTIDIIYRENDITWMVNSERESYTSQIKSMYIDTNGLNSLKSLSSTETYNNDELLTSRIYNFDLLNMSSDDYLSQELVSSSSKIGSDYLDSHYKITETEYGYSIEYLTYSDQNYINYLIYGKSEHDLIFEVYFDEFSYSSTGVNNYENIFDIEFQLLELKVGDNIFYKNAPYLIYD